MPAVAFDRAGLVDGLRQGLPLGLSVFAYGLVFGVLARHAGLRGLEAVLMSSLVFSGSAQFVALELWKMPLPVGTILLTTLVINLRHLLMGAALYPWFSHLPAARVYSTLFFLTDENWAVTMRALAQGGRNAAILLGSGLVVFAAWVSAAGVGHLLGSTLHDPTRWGLDFAFTAVLVVLLHGLYTGRADWLPWTVAAMVALVTARCLPGKWYVVLGGLAGSLVGVRRDAN